MIPSRFPRYFYRCFLRVEELKSGSRLACIPNLLTSLLGKAAALFLLITVEVFHQFL
jgi:hypothetical protein